MLTNTSPSKVMSTRRATNKLTFMVSCGFQASAKSISTNIQIKQDNSWLNPLQVTAARTTSNGQSSPNLRCRRNPLSRRPPVSRTACTPPPGPLHHPALLPPGFVQAHLQTQTQSASDFCRLCSAMLSSLSASMPLSSWFSLRLSGTRLTV